MNKIHSIYRKTRVLSQLPLEFFPSLTPPITSDTNMGTKGNFLYCTPSPLISLCSQLAHMVEVGFSQLILSLPHPILQNYGFCKLLTQSKLQTKLQLLVCMWGVCC